MKLRNRKVLVTGGSQRIGAAICRLFAQYGAKVIIHYNNSADAASTLCSELISRGTEACAIRADLMNAGMCRKLVEQACSTFNGLDILVNNASVFLPDTLKTFKREQAWEQFQVNLFAPLMLTQAFVDVCSEGRIVNLLDQRIEQIDTNNLTYTLSKKTLKDVTDALALQLAPSFTVNGVAPGAVLAASSEQARRFGPEKAGVLPLDKPPSPNQVAEAVIYLVCADSITGQTLFVDSGQHLQPQEYVREPGRA